MFASVERRLRSRSIAVLATLETRLDRIMVGWLLLAGLASTIRVATSPVKAPLDVASLLPFFLLVLAPVASMVLALRWFADGGRIEQPVTRLARVGKWRDLSRLEALRHSLYGASGIMVSLLVGILLNVPVRAAEYLAAMPALAGPIPAWLAVLHTMMTLDVVIMTSLYAIAFIAALRHVPLFPRLLAAIWMADLAMQLFTASLVSSSGDLPPTVAVALRDLLDGNVKKVLISMALWLPYLLLSTRVNVTYRHRAPA
jgi:hypothetical protein